MFVMKTRPSYSIVTVTRSEFMGGGIKRPQSTIYTTKQSGLRMKGRVVSCIREGI